MGCASPTTRPASPPSCTSVPRQTPGWTVPRCGRPTCAVVAAGGWASRWRWRARRGPARRRRTRCAPRQPTPRTELGVRTDPPDLARACRRSAADLDALALPDVLDRRRRLVAAGIPWFVALFGRDSLIAGHQARAFLPDQLLRHARGPRRTAGNGRRPGERGAARQDPPRGPPDAAALAGPRHHGGCPPVLRVDRRHPPLPDPLRHGLPVGGSARRPRGAAARRPRRARVDPGPGRPRRGRAAGVPRERPAVAGQPELEGLRERRPVPGRQPRRPARSRWSRSRATPTAPGASWPGFCAGLGDDARGGRPRRGGRGAPRRHPRALLVPGHRRRARLLRARARRP